MSWSNRSVRVMAPVSHVNRGVAGVGAGAPVPTTPGKDAVVEQDWGPTTPLRPPDLRTQDRDGQVEGNEPPSIPPVSASPVVLRSGQDEPDMGQEASGRTLTHVVQ